MHGTVLEKNPSYPLSVVIGILAGVPLLVAEWRWVHGQPFGIYKSDLYVSTGEEDFDEAIRKIKEKSDAHSESDIPPTPPPKPSPAPIPDSPTPDKPFSVE